MKVRVKFIKAHGAYAAGRVATMHRDVALALRRAGAELEIAGEKPPAAPTAPAAKKDKPAKAPALDGPPADKEE